MPPTNYKLPSDFYPLKNDVKKYAAKLPLIKFTFLYIKCYCYKRHISNHANSRAMPVTVSLLVRSQE